MFGCLSDNQDNEINSTVSPTAGTNLECNDPMGVGNGNLSTNMMLASSVYQGDSENYGVKQLSFDKPSGGWRPALNDEYQYIIVDFKEPRKISGFITQGFGYYWVSAYNIRYSSNGHHWEKILAPGYGGAEMIFQGNNDGTNRKTNYFERIIKARYFKFIPLDWSEFGIGLQFEILGCYESYSKYKSLNIMEFKLNSMFFIYDIQLNFRVDLHHFTEL